MRFSPALFFLWVFLFVCFSLSTSGSCFLLHSLLETVTGRFLKGREREDTLFAGRENFLFSPRLVGWKGLPAPPASVGAS